jgi:putative ABC transport system permease protein
VTFASAKAEMDTIGRALAKQYPAENRDESATISPMRDLGVVELKPTLLALSGAVILVLAIACLNVANLLLAQSSSRRHEFAIRAALGASRRRLAAQVLCEGLVISLAGGIAGVGVAAAGTRVLDGMLPQGILFVPYRDASAVIQLDPWTLAFTTGVALLTGILFSLAPIAALRRPNLRAAGDRSATGRLKTVRAVLVAAEVALALVVLVGAGLMIKSLTRLVTVDPGLDPANVLVIGMALPQADFYGPPVRPRYCADVVDRVGALPGVVSVGAISHLPLSGANAGRSFAVEGFTPLPGERASANYRLTCPGYFKTMGIPILKGRDFTTRDVVDGAPVAIVNEETGKRYWPGVDPIGRHIRLNDSDPWITIVGVARNVRHFGLDEAAHRELFRPYSQAAWPVMTVVVKTAIAPAAAMPPVRKALQTIDPDLPVGAGTTMSDVEEGSMGGRRFPMLLLAVFGAVALALAIVGVYGVVSYVVAQRTREIGIRVALGARRGQVIRLVVWGAMRPVIAGVVVGGIGAVFASRLLGSLLYDVKPGDPAVFAIIAVLLSCAGGAASLVPGRRATRVDPITVLKTD